MKKIKILKLAGLLALIVAAQSMLVSPAQAASVPVPGSAFLTNSDLTSNYSQAGNIGAGVFTAGSGYATIYGNGNGSGGTETSGDLLASFGAGEIQAATTYTYTIGIGGTDSTAGNYFYTQGGIGSMALLANGVAITGATLTYTPAPFAGGTPTFTTETVSFDSALNPLLVGDTLAIQFGLAPGSQASGGGGYPNVSFRAPTLDATFDLLAVPEPSTWALTLAGFAALVGMARLRERTV